MNGRTLKTYGGCGYLEAANSIDYAVETLITQQTKIEEEKSKIVFLEKNSESMKKGMVNWSNAD